MNERIVHHYDGYNVANAVTYVKVPAQILKYLDQDSLNRRNVSIQDGGEEWQCYEVVSIISEYQKAVAPAAVRSEIERFEQKCGGAFPYDETNYSALSKIERSRKIRQHKWKYMLTQRADDALLIPILDLLDDDKINKFCRDI